MHASTLPRRRCLVIAALLGASLASACRAQTEDPRHGVNAQVPGADSAAPDPSPTYWRQQREGWFWYRDPMLPPPRQSTAPAKRSKELTEFESMQQRLEDLKRIAVMNPSDTNLMAYMRYQRHVMDKSQVFAERWQRLVWSVPELDYALEGRPTNAMAANVFDDQQRDKDAQTVRALAGTHGLIFVFRSDCPFCHRFAPILKRFAQEFNLTVLAVSMDGGRLPEYPDARPDNGIATRLNARSVPALYLTQPARREIRPIGFGLMSDAELLERVATVARDLNDASAKNARTQP